MLHSRTKHVEIHFHFVREKIHARNIVMEYFPSKAQIADILTKSLHTLQFQNLKVNLIVLNRKNVSLREGVRSR